MSKVAVTDYTFPDLEIEKEILEPLDCSVEGHKKYQGPEKLKQLVTDADYVITQFAPVTAEMIEAMTRCQIIVRYGVGVDNVDLEAAVTKNIPVCNVPDYGIEEVADHTLATILALTRNLVPEWDLIRQGKWQPAVPLEKMRVLKEMTIGLIAYGRIARQVALRLKGFKCKIIVFDPFTDASVIKKDGCVPVSLDEIYAQSDLISLNCPSNDKTAGMINTDSIAKMKKGVILINQARGNIIKTNDLIEALQSGHVGAAGLDVLDPEPMPPNSPLAKMGNVIMTTHVASLSARAMKMLQKGAAQAVACGIENKPLPNVVNGILKCKSD